MTFTEHTENFVDKQGVQNILKAHYTPATYHLASNSIVYHIVVVHGERRTKSIIQCDTFDHACRELQILKARILA